MSINLNRTGLILNFIVILTVLFTTGCNQNNTEETENKPEVKPLKISTENPSGEPFLFTAPDNEVYLSWIEQKEDSSFLKFSTLTDQKWTSPKIIASGTNWFVNWADYPTISADGSGNVVAHYLPKSGEGTYAYDVQLVHSSDDGSSWRAPYILHEDGRQAEHGFVTILPYNGNFFVTWLDGRNTEMSDHESDEHMSSGGAMTLRAAIIDTEGNKLNEWELDDRVCDCCQTTAVITDHGPVVIYRDRSDKEVRDMSIVRLMDSTWTQPQPIYNDNWKIAGCPVNGPRADAIGNTMAVAWFSAPEGNAQVKVIFSEDGGASFKEPIRIDSAKTAGRVDVVMLDEETAVVSFMEGAFIQAVKVHKDGTKEQPVLVSTSSEARASGFPQMTKNGNQLIFAWTDNKEKTIKTAVLSSL